ncbi:hypothetical protein ABWL39_20570 [Chitinivorax sp. PXF-14]|uniref:hypothetical protein n=1 Tax=Chitinivorax sp. PXF-14 TaxID=3230488 RepID=UPI0034659C73
MARTQTEAAAASQVSVTALVPVNYDGTLYGPDQPGGDRFDVRAEDLGQLLDVRAVVLTNAGPV